MSPQTSESRHPLVVPALSLLFLAALAGLGYEYYILNIGPTSYVSQVETLSQELAAASSSNQQLSDALTSEQARNADFENQIHDLTGTVGQLDKLSKTDPQLLAKYSKIYFLNENYKPASLTDIPAKYNFDDKEHQFLTDALPHLEDMMDDAKDDGVNLLVLSSYRSFADQMSLKTGYKTVYGTGANAFSADQGYSEHQLGTTADFTTVKGGTLDGFDKSDAYVWLTKHAYRYGFELSYPAGNAYYVFEPWHWRYVGVKLATRLHRDSINFYDLDQRVINTYLISLF